MRLFDLATFACTVSGSRLMPNSWFNPQVLRQRASSLMRPLNSVSLYQWRPFGFGSMFRMSLSEGNSCTVLPVRLNRSFCPLLRDFALGHRKHVHVLAGSCLSSCRDDTDDAVVKTSIVGHSGHELMSIHPRQWCTPVEPHRGVNRKPTGFCGFQIEFGLQFM